MNTQNYVSRLLEQINKLNSDENKLPVLRIMIEALERICQKSDVFSNDEYMILGKTFLVVKMRIFSIVYVCVFGTKDKYLSLNSHLAMICCKFVFKLVKELSDVIASEFFLNLFLP